VEGEEEEEEKVHIMISTRANRASKERYMCTMI
jgi:hypothetical protein